MNRRKQFLSFVVAMSLAALLLPHGIGHAEAAVGLHTAPTAEDLHSVGFAEPLVRSTPTTREEDEALKRALSAYRHRERPDQVNTILTFLDGHPHSGWAPALWTNLGLANLHYGYFSSAISAWQNAWREGKNTSEPQAKALVDRAVGELARLYASLGQFDELAAFFEELGDRAVQGSATEAVQVAREALALSSTDPRHMFICGPRALSALLRSRGTNPEDVRFLDYYRAGPQGTSLAEVAGLADKAKLAFRLVFRQPGQPVPKASVVHWKVGHFATIVGEANGRFHVQDPVFPGHGLWVTPEALDQEASGYFLVPSTEPNDAGWRTVDLAEAASIRGKGPTDGTRPGDAGDPPADDSPPCPDNCDCGGMCVPNIKESSVSLTLSDNPVGYAPAIGPAARVRITYNQREANQPQNFSFFNVSPKWTLNWLSYVTDDPTNPGANVSRYLAGGGAYFYTGYTSSTGRFAAQDTDGSILILASQSPVTYRRQLRDGSVEIYAQSNGSTSFPRYVFLSQVIDPQGNAVTLNYDSQLRLTSLVDAIGRQTTFTYNTFNRPLLISDITDPFGRNAKLTYDIFGRLQSITDVIGLTSSVTYDANSLVNALTTPYGTTTFAYTAPGTSTPPRFVQINDPLGYGEREEWLEPAPIPGSDPTATVPQGMPVTLTNQYLEYRNSFHWDKHAYLLAGCTPSGGCDYTKARIRHFTHVPNTSIKSTSLESVKYPLENRIWYNYPGQSNSVNAGTSNKPIAIGRVLDDGTTQLTRMSYDTGDYFNLVQTVDPLGRRTTFTYANHIDLAAVTQATAFNNETLIAQLTYNTQHRPLAYTDAAGLTTTYTYNAAGQPTSVTNALGETTKYQYDTARNLITIVNANDVTAATFTYDAFARVRTATDSEGWTVTYDYDAADRITQITYPDATTDRYVYDRLDLAAYTDRQGRRWRYAYDANRRLTAITDPLGQQTLFGYTRSGKLASLTDPNGYVTTWTYDVQGRLISKQYADTSTVSYTYEATTSRLKLVTDALGQTKQYAYANDDRLAGITYVNAVNPTPSVTFAYDPWFPRVTAMTDGTGTTQYSYVPVGVPGALQLQQEIGALANSAIAYAYDRLGRISSRTVAGAGAETFAYDTLGRLTGHTSDLGAFAVSYLGQTSQITQRRLLPVSSPLATDWSYLPNTGDRRLASIANTGLSAGQFSNFQFTTTPENFITAITETSDAATAYPATGSQSATYNNLNQLTDLSGQALAYDLNGNLTADGVRTYAWDAENRLVGIGYPGQPGKATSFAYDGLDRRTTITRTPAGGGTAVATFYLWCGSRICQARDGANTPTRGYYDEGELVAGAPGQPLYYGIDQIGSVRRAFASAGAPAYGYDPYGVALQGTVPLTDFGFAGMLREPDSGLYLTQYRAYDPVAGRWSSRDPLGEMSELGASMASASVAAASGPTRVITRALFNPENAQDGTASGYWFAPQENGERLERHASFIGNVLDRTRLGDRVGLNGHVSLYLYAAQNPIVYIDPTGERISRRGIDAFIRACMLAWRMITGNPEIKIPEIKPPPTITRPTTPPGPSSPPPSGPKPPTPPTQ